MNNEKDRIRKTILQCLNKIPDANHIDRSRKVCSNIIQSRMWINAEVVFLFMPFGKEINIQPLGLEALKLGKTCGVPVISGRQMDFYIIEDFSPPCFSVNYYGIAEPIARKLLVPEDGMDSLMIVPGVAFTKTGKRLGWGGGYYDKYLAKWKSHLHTAGVCFSEQILEDLPTEEHDQGLDTVIFA